MDSISEQKFLCPKCGSSKSTSLVSIAKHTYEYCSECNFNCEECNKQIEFDFIFKQIIHYLNKNNERSLKIEIANNDDSITLILNGNNIFTRSFTYELLNTDIYFLENTIFELLEDIDNNLKLKANIIVCE